MNIRFTNESDGNGWVTGKVDYNGREYKFTAKVFEEGSIHGINEGRVSKLMIRNENTTGWYGVFVNYDRGWDIEPETEEQQDVFINVLEFLHRS